MTLLQLMGKCLPIHGTNVIGLLIDILNQVKLILLFAFITTNGFTLMSQALYRCESDNNGSRIVGRQLSSVPGGSPGGIILHESEFVGVGPRSIAFDDVNRKMYWVNLTENTLNQSNLDGTAEEVLVSEGYQPFDLVVSSTLSKLFWTDQGGFLIQSNLDGTDIELLREDIVPPPRSISIHDELGLLFWLENNKIKRLDLTSGAVQSIITNNGNHLNDHVIDQMNNKILWTDQTAGTVKRANLDGSEVEILHNALEEKKPFGIAVFPENYRIYWSESDTQNSTLWSGDIFGSSRLRLANLTDGHYWCLEMTFEDIPNAIDDLFRTENFLVYPNPTNNIININLEGINPADNLLIELVDLHGKTIMTDFAIHYSTQLDLSGISNGSYFIVLKVDGKEISSKKIIKQ